MSEQKPYFDLAVILPLPEEFEACTHQFEIVENLSRANQLRLVARIPGVEARILLIEQRDMGKLQARRAADGVLSDFDIGLLACVGIAAGLSKDVNIGDVCYTGVTLDITENIKVSLKGGKDVYALSPVENHTPDEISIKFRLTHVMPSTKPNYEAWQKVSFETAANLVPGKFKGKDERLEVIVLPSARQGVIACGMVSASPDYNEAIRRAERRILALETESAGVFEAAYVAEVPVVSIRGVSDYAGADKTLFERETNNQARLIAARNAISYLRMQLESRNILEFLDARKGRTLGLLQSAMPIAQETEEEAFTRVLQDQHALIDERLRELAPGYDLLNRGYHLPVPRIRLRLPRTASATPEVSEPVDVRAALSQHRIITVKIPQGYPEKSLSWAMALNILTGDFGPKQALPFVIGASELIPPRKGIQEIVDTSLERFLDSPFCQGVCIVDDFDYATTNRTRFLAKQIRDQPSLRFLIVSRNTTNAVIETSFRVETQAIEAHLSPVPFIALTQFVRQNFQLSAQASDVIATRLHGVFKRFRLTLHPSYFAGVSRDALAAILNANRRADLIELAVTGYLSYAVAGDSERNRLSRRAREQFLADLAFQLRVERKSLSEADLFSQASDLAKRMDYSISPSSFVAWFAQHRILHFEGSLVRFTLPFMEAFLLARRLSAAPNEALRYFDLRADHFDYSCFQLYAEIGASEILVDGIIDLLHKACESLAQRSRSVLATNAAQPALLKHLVKVRQLQEDLERAKEDVRLERDKSDEKQRLLDAAERIQETTASKSSIQATSADPDPTILSALRAWSLAAALLGSGAEQLVAVKKREIATLLVRLTALSIEDWTYMATNFDFSQLRVELKADADIGSMFADRGKDAKRLAERVVDAVVDVAEFVVQSLPFLTMANRLCGEAHDVLLAESVANIDQGMPLEQMVRALWLVSLDAERGRRPLEKSVRVLKNAKLARVALSQHLQFQAVWQTPNSSDQNILLDLADSALKAINSTVNRGQMGGDGAEEGLPD